MAKGNGDKKKKKAMPGRGAKPGPQSITKSAVLKKAKKKAPSYRESFPLAITPPMKKK